GPSKAEQNENKEVLSRFEEALENKYGPRIADFAMSNVFQESTLGYFFPSSFSLKRSLEQGSVPLSARTIQQVSANAHLFEEVLRACENPIFQAVEADARAVEACRDYKVQYSLLKQSLLEATEARQSSNEAKKTVFAKIENFIQHKSEEKDPLDPISKEDLVALEQFKKEWIRSIAENRFQTSSDTALFSKFINAVENTPQDRFVIAEDHTEVTAAPRSWTGTIFQFLGRNDQHVQENRRTIASFKEALTSKYGAAIANFAFPTSASRMNRGSRLSGKTISETIERAGLVKNLYDSVEKDMNISATSAQEAAVKEYRYEQQKIRCNNAYTHAESSKVTAQRSHQNAESVIADYLLTHAVNKNITPRQNATFMSLWFEEAKIRYNRIEPPRDEAVIPVAVPLSSFPEPSAPPLNDQDLESLRKNGYLSV
ncbi:MAG: hypothetical protein K9M81_03765, partial [Chthoniobacterales bacterium]|nr:hypothetical protein [Chthoniobacterales bacterium]